MKTSQIIIKALAFSLVGVVAIIGQSAWATQQVWVNTTGTDFNAGPSWVSGTAPGAGDVAAFTATEASQPKLSASVSIAGLFFSGTSSSGYDLTNTAGETLTLTATANTIGAETKDSNSVAIGAQNTSGTNTIDVPVILGAAAASSQTFFQAGGGTLILSGAISSTNNPITLRLTGTGTFNLNAANSYTGTTTQAANNTIVIGNSAAFGASTNPLNLANANGTLQASTDLTLANAIPNPITYGNATASMTLNNSGTFGMEFSGSMDLGGVARTITSAVSAGATFSGVISNDAGGGLVIVASSGSVVTLTNTNIYTGNTTISGSVAVTTIMNQGVSGNLGAGTTVNLGSGTKGGTLAYNGPGETSNRIINLNGTTGGATIDVSGATGPITLTSDFMATGAGNKTLTLRGGNGSTISGAIPDSSGFTTAVVKQLGGAWNISGANTYSGGTTINNGTLVLQGSTATLGTGDVTLNSGATKLQITTGVVNGIGDSATLSIANGPVVQVGTGVQEVVGGLKLNGVDQAPGTYDNSNEPTFITGNGEIIVVPEPSIWTMAMAGTGLLLALQKLRRRRT